MRPTRRRFIHMAALACTGIRSLRAAKETAVHLVTWARDADRTWAGPELWANRLEDWRVRGGWLECVRDGAWPMRTVHLLTRRLARGDGAFTLSVDLALQGKQPGVAADAGVGFLVGAGSTMDYRSAALIHHTPGAGGGLFAGVDPAGKLFVRDFEKPLVPRNRKGAAPTLPARVTLRLEGRPGKVGGYQLLLTATDPVKRTEIARLTHETTGARMVGNVALVSHPGSGPDTARFAFRDWRLSGPKLEVHPDRTCGPVLCTQYTVHNGTLKLTAQLLPVGKTDAGQAVLELKRDGRWQPVSKAELVVPGWTATFRIDKWDASQTVPFRVVYPLADASGKSVDHTHEGTIQRDPVDRDTLVLAGLSCVQQVLGRVDTGKLYPWSSRVWFPHLDMIPRVMSHKPDLLFFAGDQIYEGNPTRPIREPAEDSELDYLYKWYLWCWAYRDILRHTPTITIPDDHDVYQGNIWGAGGNPARKGDPAGLLGGYGMPVRWINMMQRTQTSHLPDPFDPTPAAQGIGVYYTSLIWGKVGFAILEDRKFKSPPTLVKAKMTLDSHIIEKDYDTRKADVPGAQLLGARQEKFLDAFARDWRGQVMKAALSQTIFCNLQISSRGETAGQLDRDLDSGGWPQSGRRRALEALRRGLMVHIAGDQHLASLLQQGIDDWDDGPWSLCVPAVSNVYLRFWNPSYRPANYRAGMPSFMGRYQDGFHNRFTVHAVANPVNDPKPGQFPEPVELYRKAVGYGIVRFDKSGRTITMEVWPRQVDPRDGKPYPGWPRTIRMEDNDGRRPVAYLPTLRIRGVVDAVVRITEEKTGELVYARRIQGTEFRPKVYREGTYTLEVGEPGTTRVRVHRKVAAGPADKVGAIDVSF